MTIKITLEEARSLLVIDKDALDDEVTMQASILEFVGRELVRIESLRDEVKEEVSVIDAQISSHIRKEAVQAGEKVTENSILEKVLVHQRHKEAMEEYLELKKEAADWKTIRDCFVDRSNMLSTLGRLYVSEYFVRESVNIDKKASDLRSEIRRRLLDEKNNKRSKV